MDELDDLTAGIGCGNSEADRCPAAPEGAEGGYAAGGVEPATPGVADPNDLRQKNEVQPESARGDIPHAIPTKPQHHISPRRHGPKAKGGKKTVQPPALDDAGATALVPTAGPLATAGELHFTGATQSTTERVKTDLTVQPGQRPHGTAFDLEKVRKYAASLDCKLHPILFAFTPLPAADYQRLRQSIRDAGGLHVPIVTWNGKIIDGLHRLAACMEEKLPPKTQEWDGHGSLVKYVTALNTCHRPLTEENRVVTAVELLPHLKDEAKERQRLHGGTAPGRPSETLLSNLTGVSKGSARDVVAQLCGVSSGSVSALAKVKSEAPDLYEQVRAGKITVHAADMALKARRQETKSATHGTHQDVAQGGGEDGSPTPETPAPAASTPKSQATREPAPPEGAQAGQHDNPEPTGSGKPAPADHTPASDGHPCNDAAPHHNESPDDEASSQGWTVKSVDDALCQISKALVGLGAIAGDQTARICISELDHERRKVHHRTLHQINGWLGDLVILLGHEET